jgi:hypothetical protein
MVGVYHHIQLFSTYMESCKLFCLADSVILLILASQEARITGMSHWHLVPSDAAWNQTVEGEATVWCCMLLKVHSPTLGQNYLHPILKKQHHFT